MSFSKFEKIEMSPEQNVGIAIKAIDVASRAMHVGLLYAHSSGAIHFAHLAFHHDLRDDPAPTKQDYLWSVCTWLADPAMKETARFMANYIEAVVTQADDVDYGMNPSGVGFDASGQFFSLDPNTRLASGEQERRMFKRELKPFEAVQWVRRPSGRGPAGQPEASLARVRQRHA